jgi:hypothetical protein
MTLTAYVDVIPLDRARFADRHSVSGDFLHIARDNVPNALDKTVQHMCAFVGRLREYDTPNRCASRN